MTTLKPHTLPIILLSSNVELANRLGECYAQISWEEGYRLAPEFFFSPRLTWQKSLPAQSPGLVFIEMESEAVDIESLLIASIRKFNTRLQIVLVVEPDMDYFRVAQNCLVSNIIRKKQFDPAIIRALTIRLLTGNIFGFDPYFPHGFEVGPLYKTYAGQVEVQKVIQEGFDFFHTYVHEEEKANFRMFLHELLLNTFSYAIEGITPENRDKYLLTASPEIFIPERKAIKVSFAVDHEKIGFSIQDSSGNLSMLRLLEKLRRQSCIGDEKLPPGIWDESGRGMSLVHRYSRFIVNILRGVRTETIFLQYHEKELNQFESIIITEIT